MRLKQHLAFIEDFVRSRRDCEVEHLLLREIEPDRVGLAEGRLRFWDGSLLKFAEQLTAHGMSLVKARYTYHYQDGAGQLLFRCDNAPHLPEVVTHPHHKHLGEPGTGGETLVPAEAPDLAAVVREIEGYLYRDGA